MLKQIFIYLLIALPLFTSAKITPENLMRLHHYEDSLKILGDTIVNGSQQVIRQEACYGFIKVLVKALKIDGSFDYPFDSLTAIGILYPEDRSFRIFNWNLLYVNGTYRYYGAIQKNSRKTEVYPLYDYSDYFKTNPEDTVTSNERWYGVLYYKIVKQGKYYMLFGWDGYNLRSNKKVIDVLTFNKKGNPVFGAPIFNFGTLKEPKLHSRFIIEYKKTAQVSVNYDAGLKMIVYDHLIPLDPKAEGMYFLYVPDGSYEGFEFKKKKWQHISSVWNTTQSKPPFPAPVDFNKKKENYKK